MGCHFLLQGIFLTQGSNLGLLHCRQMLYHLSHLRSNHQLQSPVPTADSLYLLVSPGLLLLPFHLTVPFC